MAESLSDTSTFSILAAPADPEISLRIYYAQAGESLFEIARRFAVSPGKMREANDLPEGAETLSAPRRLLVPSG